MAKRKSNSPVVIDKAKFLLPKMEFFPLNEATGEGIYIKEIGGKSLLECKELIEKMEAEAGEGAEISTSQGIELMVFFVLRSACYQDGTPFFTEEDVALLAEKSPALLQDMADKAMTLAGMNPVAVAEVIKTLPNALPVSSTIA